MQINFKFSSSFVTCSIKLVQIDSPRLLSLSLSFSIYIFRSLSESDSKNQGCQVSTPAHQMQMHCKSIALIIYEISFNLQMESVPPA